MSAHLSRIPRLVSYACLFVALYGALHALGLRDWVSVLSGTPAAAVPRAVAAPAAALYLLAYFGAVLIAPILLIAAAVAAFVDSRVGSWARRIVRAKSS